MSRRGVPSSAQLLVRGLPVLGASAARRQRALYLVVPFLVLVLLIVWRRFGRRAPPRGSLSEDHAKMPDWALAHAGNRAVAARSDASMRPVIAARLTLPTGARVRGPENEPALSSPSFGARPSQSLARSARHSEPDDLTVIKGIGRKVAGLLAEEGITSFSGLADADPAHLREVLRGAGLAMLNPGSWPQQARLAMRGEFGRMPDSQTLRDQREDGSS